MAASHHDTAVIWPQHPPRRHASHAADTGAPGITPNTSLRDTLADTEHLDAADTTLNNRLYVAAEYERRYRLLRKSLPAAAGAEAFTSHAAADSRRRH